MAVVSSGVVGSSTGSPRRRHGPVSYEGMSGKSRYKGIPRDKKGRDMLEISLWRKSKQKRITTGAFELEDKK